MSGRVPDGTGLAGPEGLEPSGLHPSGGIPRAVKRCPKHEPIPPLGLIERLRGDVMCAKCGMRGAYSNGQRKFGRPRRIIWFRRSFMEREQ